MAVYTNARVRMWMNDTPLTVFTLSHATVTEYANAMEYEDSGRFAVAQKVRVAGRAMLFGDEGGTAFAAFRAAVYATQTATNPFNFAVEVRTAGGTYQTIATYAEDRCDNRFGPKVELSSPQQFGVYGMSVEFAFEVHRPPQDLDDALPIASHVWTQEMKHGVDNRIVRVVKGEIRAAIASDQSTTTPAPSNTAADWKVREPSPDLFRLAIVPDLLGEDWQRDSMVFLPEHDRLRYEFVDSQNRVATPYPARDADYSFRYERGFPDVGIAMGTMRVRLVADLATDVRALLIAAWNLMPIRVDPQGNLIRRISVEEENMGKQIAVNCEMVTQFYAANNESSTTGSLTIAAMVGRPFTITNPVTMLPVNPYGAYGKAWWAASDWKSAVLTAMKQQSDAPNLNKATCTAVTLTAPTTDASTIAATASTTDLSTINQHFGGTFAQPFPVQAVTGSGSTSSRSVITVTEALAEIEYRSGMVRMASAQNDAADWTFQTEKPSAFVREMVKVKRLSQEPPKSLRPAPTGAMLVRETFRAWGGESDSQGNRLYPCEFMREFVLTDPGTATLGWSTVSGRRQWTPPEGYFLCGYSPAFDSDSQTSLVSALGATVDTRQRVVAATETLIT